MSIRCPTEQLFRERGSGLDKVLATVQHDQNLPVLQEFEEFRQRIGRESRKPECTGNGSGHQLRIRDRRQVDNAGTVRIGSAQVVGGSRSNRGFADTPGPTIVTKRLSGKRVASVETTDSRPIVRVDGEGMLYGCSAALPCASKVTRRGIPE
jgi:hypothetical protein